MTRNNSLAALMMIETSWKFGASGRFGLDAEIGQVILLYDPRDGRAIRSVAIDIERLLEKP